MSLEHLADHILAVADRSESSITNLELQKILFFTVGMSIRNNPDETIFFKKIYNDDFEKWRYGPVVPSLYFKYNIFGAKPIESKGKYNERFQRFDEIIINLSNIDVYRLVALSHDMKAWATKKTKILDGSYVPPYTIEEIVRDFKNA